MKQVQFFVEDRSDKRFGKGWARVVKSVDPKSKNGYGIEGDFIRLDTWHEMDMGTLIICVFDHGSNKYHSKHAYLYRVGQDDLEDLGCYSWCGAYIALRDRLVELLNEGISKEDAAKQQRIDALKDYSVEELMEEIKRRQGVDSE